MTAAPLSSVAPSGTSRQVLTDAVDDFAVSLSVKP